MKPELVTDAKSRQRFIDEAKVGARIESAHVVEVIGAGVDEATGMPWLAMELLDGDDLEAVMRRAGPLPLEEVVRLFEQLAHALGRAHAQGIIHRDLKPENLFLARSKQHGVASALKILDFGIATLVASDKTAATVTTAIGSPLWIAPEQTATGAKLRPSTDVWAMGLIAFYLLTGKSYWPAASAEPFNLNALITEIVAYPLVAASTRAAELGVTLSPALDGWFSQCIVREPEARFTDANAASEALASLVRGVPAAPARQVALTVPLAAGGVPGVATGPTAGPP